MHIFQHGPPIGRFSIGANIRQKSRSEEMIECQQWSFELDSSRFEMMFFELFKGSKSVSA